MEVQSELYRHAETPRARTGADLLRLGCFRATLKPKPKHPKLNPYIYIYIFIFKPQTKVLASYTLTVQPRAQVFGFRALGLGFNPITLFYTWTTPETLNPEPQTLHPVREFSWCLLRRCSHYIRGCVRYGNASEEVGESLGSGLGVMYWGAAGEWVGSTKEDNC